MGISYDPNSPLPWKVWEGGKIVAHNLYFLHAHREYRFHVRSLIANRY